MKHVETCASNLIVCGFVSDHTASPDLRGPWGTLRLPHCPPFIKTQSSSMRTIGMAVFKQQKVEDFYDIGEELGR